MDRLSLTLAVILIIFRYSVLGILEEPVCSKYHFEEKVLEKVIKLEVLVEQELNRLQKEVSVADAKLSAFADSMKNDVARLMENVSKIDGINRDDELATKEKGLHVFQCIENATDLDTITCTWFSK